MFSFSLPFSFILFLFCYTSWIEFGGDSHLNNLSPETSKNNEWHKILPLPILNNPDQGYADQIITNGKLYFNSWILLGNNFVLTDLDLESGKIGGFELTKKGYFAQTAFIDDSNTYYVALMYVQDYVVVADIKNNSVIRDMEIPFTPFNFQACLYKENIIGMEIDGIGHPVLKVESSNFLDGTVNWVTRFNVTDTFIYTITIDDDGIIYFLHKPNPEEDQNVIIQIDAETGKYQSYEISDPITDSISQVRISVSNTQDKQIYFPASLSNLPNVDATIFCFSVDEDDKVNFSWKFSLEEVTEVGDVKISKDGSTIGFLAYNRSTPYLYSLTNKGELVFKLDISTNVGYCGSVNVLPNGKFVVTCKNYTGGIKSRVFTYVYDGGGMEVENWDVLGHYPFFPVFDSSNNMYYCVTNGLDILSYSYCRKKSLK